MSKQVETFSSDFNFSELSNDTSSKITVDNNNKTEQRKEARLIKQAVEQDEDIEQHQDLVIKLTRYGNSKRFASYLQSMNFDLKPATLKKKDVHELEEILNRVHMTINCKNQDDIFQGLVFTGIGTVEKLSSIPRVKETFDITGLTQMLQQDEQFLDLIEQIELENQSYTNISPMKRMALILAKSCLTVNAMNQLTRKGLARLQALKKKSEDEEEVKQDMTNFVNDENTSNPSPIITVKSKDEILAALINR